MTPLIVAGIAALVAVLAVGIVALGRAAARGDAQLDVDARTHEFAFSHDVMFLLTLYAIGWEVDEIEWWPFGSLDHDNRTPAIEWVFSETEPEPAKEAFIETLPDGTVRWKARF